MSDGTPPPGRVQVGLRLKAAVITPLMRDDLAIGTKSQTQGIDPSGPKALSFVETEVEMVGLSQ